MSVFITEHWGQEAQERQSVGAPLASYSLSSASTPTLPNAKANFIRVTADAGSLLSWFSSSTTASTLTSTNAMRIAANVAAERFQLVEGSTVLRIQAAST